MPQGQLKRYTGGGTAPQQKSNSAKAKSKNKQKLKKGRLKIKPKNAANKQKLKKGRLKIKPKNAVACLQAKLDRKVTGAITKNIESLMAARASKAGGTFKILKPVIDESLLSAKGVSHGDKASKACQRRETDFGQCDAEQEEETWPQNDKERKSTRASYKLIATSKKEKQPAPAASS
eukprot:g12149.t1